MADVCIAQAFSKLPKPMRGEDERHPTVRQNPMN
jgi:hypothetical protein